MDGSAPPYAHLMRMTDSVGLAEHCQGTRPRWELGYCVDDVARALVVIVRDPAPGAGAGSLTERYLAIILDAVSDDGQVHNQIVVPDETKRLAKLALDRMLEIQ